mmetsp:Transcript_17493/g.52504  ORF Transcript_17493/g.52504 Transcript_17493/m.52504 type:complete len:201 (-) Transcript_17493:864-1466(-)
MCVPASQPPRSWPIGCLLSPRSRRWRVVSGGWCRRWRAAHCPRRPQCPPLSRSRKYRPSCALRRPLLLAYSRWVCRACQACKCNRSTWGCPTWGCRPTTRPARAPRQLPWRSTARACCGTTRASRACSTRYSPTSRASWRSMTSRSTPAGRSHTERRCGRSQSSQGRPSPRVASSSCPGRPCPRASGSWRSSYRVPRSRL